MDKISLFLEQDSQKISSEGSTQVAAQKFSEGTEFAEDRLADFTADRTDDGGTDRLGCLLAGLTVMTAAVYCCFMCSPPQSASSLCWAARRRLTQ